MSETKAITQQAVGYSFAVTIEKETRQDNGTKYPDKTVTKATLGGHTDTHSDAVQMLEQATAKIRERRSAF